MYDLLTDNFMDEIYDFNSKLKVIQPLHVATSQHLSDELTTARHLFKELAAAIKRLKKQAKAKKEGGTPKKILMEG